MILLLLWDLGVVSSYTMGAFIHILLGFAVILLVVNLLQGKRRVQIRLPSKPEKSLAMRFIAIVSLPLAAAVLLLGCEQKSPPNPATESKVSNAKEKIGEAAKAKRDEYAREMGKQFDELNAKFEQLKARTAKAEGQARKDLEKKLEETKVKRDAAAKKLDELKVTSADRWEKIKDGVGDAFNDLKKSFE